MSFPRGSTSDLIRAYNQRLKEIDEIATELSERADNGDRDAFEWSSRPRLKESVSFAHMRELFDRVRPESGEQYALVNNDGAVEIWTQSTAVADEGVEILATQDELNEEFEGVWDVDDKLANSIAWHMAALINDRHGRNTPKRH